jgi:hypothetical protein
MGQELLIGVCADVHNDDRMPDCIESLCPIMTKAAAYS